MYPDCGHGVEVIWTVKLYHMYRLPVELIDGSGVYLALIVMAGI